MNHCGKSIFCDEFQSVESSVETCLAEIRGLWEPGTTLGTSTLFAIKEKAKNNENKWIRSIEKSYYSIPEVIVIKITHYIGES